MSTPEQAREGMRRLRARRKTEREAAKPKPKAPAKSDAQRKREQRERDRQKARDREDTVRLFLTDVLSKAEKAMEEGYGTAAHATQAVTAQELLEALDATQSVPVEDILGPLFLVVGVQGDPEGQQEVMRDIERSFESLQRAERRRAGSSTPAGVNGAVIEQVAANLQWAHERLTSEEGAPPADINAGLAAAKRLISARGNPTRQADLREYAVDVQTRFLQQALVDPDAFYEEDPVVLYEGEDLDTPLTHAQLLSMTWDDIQRRERLRAERDAAR